MDVTCPCGTTFAARNSRAKYHSDRCRKRAQRTTGVVVDLPADSAVEAEVGASEAATYRELEGAGKLETSIGQSCLVLARRLDRPGVDTGSALASVAARLDELMAKATKGTGAVNAPQQLRDELALRRTRGA